MCWVRKSESESQAVCFPSFAINLTNTKEVLDEITKRVTHKLKQCLEAAAHKRIQLCFREQLALLALLAGGWRRITFPLFHYFPKFK